MIELTTLQIWMLAVMLGLSVVVAFEMARAQVLEIRVWFANLKLTPDQKRMLVDCYREENKHIWLKTLLREKAEFTELKSYLTHAGSGYLYLPSAAELQGIRISGWLLKKLLRDLPPQT